MPPKSINVISTKALRTHIKLNTIVLLVKSPLYD